MRRPCRVQVAGERRGTLAVLDVTKSDALMVAIVERIPNLTEDAGNRG